MIDVAHHTGPIVVTLAYLALYYGFQIHIMFVKGRLVREYSERGERFDRYFGQDRHMLAADRIQLNTLEHMPPFLCLLWLNAVVVGPAGATIAGAVYVAARAYYPFVVGRRLGRGIRTRVLMSTGVGYVVLTYLMGTIVVALAGAGS
jgi:hypothetical protein